MYVHVGSRLDANAWGLGYKAVYDDRATVQAVIDDFAKRFSVSAKLCTAWLFQKRLKGTELLLQIATGNRQVLVLSMDFTPSLALYIWQSFRKGLWQAVQQYDDVKDVWVFAAEICSTQGCIAESMSDSTAFLSALLALDPLRPLSVFRLLHDAYPRHPPDPYTLPQEQPMVQNLLLFAQLLAAVAADNSSVLKMEIASVAPDSTEHREILRSAIASKLQQLTDISSCTPALLSNSTTGQTGAPQALPAPSQRVITLRSAALISKLATLTFSVKADLVGHLDPEMPMSVQSLWHSMSTLARSLNKLAQLDGAMSDGASQEDQALCFQLCMLLVDTLRQASKEAQAGKQKQACLGLLWAALINMLTELLRSAVKKLGLLPLLVAFLDHGKEEARYALQILMLLCAPRIDSGSQHADLLARLQGVRRLSNIFTAVQASKGPAKASGAEEYSVAIPRPAATAPASQKHLLADVKTMDDAADLILRLLKSHPLSPQSPPEVSSAQSGQDGAQVASKHNPVGSTTAEVASQAPAASPCSEQWPTPKASQWQDIELVATRACIALGWALSPGVVHHAEEAVWSLAAQLYQLVQRLVIGHLLDLDLCVRKLFRLGLHPILRFHIDGHAESTSLTVAMLSRMAMDCSAIAVGWLHAEQICLIFCKESSRAYISGATSALLTAASRVLHFVMPKMEPKERTDGIVALFTTAFEYAMCAFSDSLPDRLLLCACLGGLVAEAGVQKKGQPACRQTLIVQRLRGSLDLIFTTLEQAMQVPTPWDQELCLATAIMLNRCSKSLFQSMSSSCDAMLSLVVQLLHRLQGFRTTDNQRLQRLLLAGCCVCLRGLCQQSSPANHSAVVSAIRDWIVALVPDKSETEPAAPKLDPMVMLPGLPALHACAILDTLSCTVTAYLDSQQRWHQFVQNGLQSFLLHLCASMHLAAKVCMEQEDVLYTPVHHGFEVMSTASKHHALRPPCLEANGAMTASACGAAHTTQGSADGVLLLLWRRVACAAVTLLYLHCRDVHLVHKQHKDNRQELLKLRQKKDSRAADVTMMDKLQNESSSLLAQLRLVQQQIETLLPALHDIQQEPVWPSIVAAHQPQDWPGSMPPTTPGYRQNVLYLSSEKLLNDEAAQAIHSFYTFMLGEVGATAAAEQLVAEEADEAAKAAARKAKKQKAKARKQQARSDAIAASEPTTAPSLQSQQDVEQASPLPHSSPSASSGSTSDQDAASLQSQLQQNPAQSSAGHTLPVHVALDEPRLASTAVAGGSSAGSSAAIDAPRGADATFLDQLFCCPITKVVMVDPVIAADGHTYERTAIQHWLQGSSLSPVTRDKLPHTRLVPNVLVKSALAQHAGLS